MTDMGNKGIPPELVLAWEALCPDDVVHVEYIARQAFRAGRESMREEAAKVCDKLAASEQASSQDRRILKYAGATINALPISEE